MSRGLGKWELLILAEIEKNGFAWIGAIADSVSPTLSSKQAAVRAAQSLSKKGLIVSATYPRGDRGNYKLLACPPGTSMDYVPSVASSSRKTG